MIVGDFLDAMGGYNEGELERFKGIAELVRKSTSLLWDTQVDQQSRLSPEDLWPFRWDKNPGKKTETISVEEKQRRQDAQDEYLLKNF